MTTPLNLEKKDEKSTRLPYFFAKTHGIVVTEDLNADIVQVYYLADTPLSALTEVKRHLQKPLDLNLVNSTEFQQHLAQTYQANTSLLDATEGSMEEDLDLLKLAGQLPTSEDLLDTHDDAPIIRLINALFTQAIKQKASDIHIETYEDRVLVRNRVDGVLQEILDIRLESQLVLRIFFYTHFLHLPYFLFH